eukprot:4077336-Prymnesium_polylepis.2
MIAVPLHPEPHRVVSLDLLARELGATRKRSQATKAAESVQKACAQAHHASTYNASKVALALTPSSPVRLRRSIRSASVEALPSSIRSASGKALPSSIRSASGEAQIVEPGTSFRERASAGRVSIQRSQSWRVSSRTSSRRRKVFFYNNTRSPTVGGDGVPLP